MPGRRTFVTAVLLVTLLLAVSGGFVVAHLSQAQAPSARQTRPTTATQQTNPGLLALSGTPQTPGATYRQWKLASFTFEGRPQALVTNVSAVFILNSQGLQVFGHICNAIGEKYAWSQDHSRLIAQGAWMTQMLCGKPGVMDLETNYLAALKQVTTYRRDQSGITLRDDAGRYVLRYAPLS